MQMWRWAQQVEVDCGSLGLLQAEEAGQGQPSD